MTVEQRRDEFVPVHRDRNHVNLDIASAQGIVDVLFEALQQFPGRTAGHARLVIELVTTERHHGADQAPLDHPFPIAVPGFPDSTEGHRQEVAG